MKIAAQSIVAFLLAASLALAPLGCSLGSQQGEEGHQNAPSADSSAEPQQATVESEDPNRIIEVEVVESETRGETTVTYAYDENGRLVSSESLTPNTPQSGSLTTYNYDEAGRVSSAVTAMEYIDWGNSYQELFTYDDTGYCAIFASEILSQGDGATTVQFIYDNEGRPVSAISANYSRGGGESARSNIEWVYTDDGHIQYYGTTAGGYPNERLTSSAEQLAEGVYVYESTSNTGTNYTEIHYGPNGRVDKVVNRGDSYKSPEVVAYTYTTIQVVASEWLPSVYSNPTGFPLMALPQLSNAQIAAIKGE